MYFYFALWYMFDINVRSYFQDAVNLHINYFIIFLIIRFCFAHCFSVWAGFQAWWENFISYIILISQDLRLYFLPFNETICTVFACWIELIVLLSLSIIYLITTFLLCNSPSLWDSCYIAPWDLFVLLCWASLSTSAKKMLNIILANLTGMQLESNQPRKAR